MVAALQPAQVARHAEMLTNRVRKNLRRLSPTFARAGIEAFRVYDWDIPEVRARVDHYAGHFVVSELTRRQTAGIGYLEALVEGLQQGLALPSERVVGKRRRTRPGRGQSRYTKQDARGECIVVREDPLKFRVNLHDYVDTGLFADHRELRARVMAEAKGLRVLNLFAYTGSFSVAALAGGAREVTSVDLSGVYLAWTLDNLRENHIPVARHQAVRSDVRSFLRERAARGERWDSIVLDPPSFSTVGGHGGFDVQRDHPALLDEALGCLNEGGILYFASNHQRFEPRFDAVRGRATEITEAVAPREYRVCPHRTFVLRHPDPVTR